MIKDFLFYTRSFIFNYGIPTYNVLSEYVNTYYNYVAFTFNNLVNGYNANTLYFYENNPNTYISSYTESSNANIIWKYDIFNNIFYNYVCSYKDLKRFKIVMASIKLDDTVVYDLSDFISELRVESSNLNNPDLNHILGVFEYKFRTVLDRNKPYKFEYMDTNLDIRILDLFSNEALITNCEKN